MKVLNESIARSPWKRRAAAADSVSAGSGWAKKSPNRLRAGRAGRLWRSCVASAAEQGQAAQPQQRRRRRLGDGDTPPSVRLPPTTWYWSVRPAPAVRSLPASLPVVVNSSPRKMKEKSPMLFVKRKEAQRLVVLPAHDCLAFEVANHARRIEKERSVRARSTINATSSAKTVTSPSRNRTPRRQCPVPAPRHHRSSRRLPGCSSTNRLAVAARLTDVPLKPRLPRSSDPSPEAFTVPLPSKSAPAQPVSL